MNISVEEAEPDTMGGATGAYGPSLGVGWYVVQTKRRREAVAAAFLARAGLNTYSPLTLEWPPPAVGSQVVPMFPGYIFVRADLPRNHYRIVRSVGVKSLLCVGGSPASVEAAALDCLRQREDTDGIIRPGAGPGERVEVQISKGPFRGLTALVEERLPARERVRVLLQILHREVPVEIPERWVRRA